MFSTPGKEKSVDRPSRLLSVHTVSNWAFLIIIFFSYSLLSDFSLPELLIEATEPDYIFAVSNWHFQL